LTKTDPYYNAEMEKLAQVLRDVYIGREGVDRHVKWEDLIDTFKKKWIDMAWTAKNWFEDKGYFDG